MQKSFTLYRLWPRAVDLYGKRINARKGNQQRQGLQYMRAVNGGSPVAEQARQLLAAAGIAVIDCPCAECSPVLALPCTDNELRSVS